MAFGKRVPMTNDRRLICDIVYQARRMPLVPLEKTFDVSELSRLRRLVEPKISWAVIMMRAYGLVSAANPVLRRVYVPLPRQHFFEAPESVCMMTINRKVEGQEKLVFARFCRPELYSLQQLEEQFENYRKAPLESLKQVRHQFRFASMPWWIRKIGWGLMNTVMPRGRVRMTGTFGMSLSGLRDTVGTWHLGPCTTTLGYDQFCKNGKARITLTFDHRVLDGMPAFEILEEFEKTLKGQILCELQGMAAECAPKQAIATGRETAPPPSRVAA